MAHIQNAIIGRARKQAGGMVFYTLFGKNTMRSKPFAYRDKNSTAQQLARALFLATVALGAALKFYASSFFQTAPVGMSPYSKILSQVRAAFEYVGNVLTFKPSGKVIGSGSLPLASGVTVSNVDPSDFTVSFSTALTSPSELATDVCKILVTSTDGSKAALIDLAVARSTGFAAFTVPADFGAAPTKVFISYPIFYSVDGTKQSPTLLSDNNTGVTL